ncbi:MAG: divergent PAP2 family protein [Eubacteriales bacterium]|nr:divergent PAP2 family protein [Eubacteriales bacterium]
MHSVVGIFSNHAVFCALIAWFAAQALKIPLYYLVEKKWDFKRFVGSGGMPSSHSAMVVSLAIMVGAIEGFGSTQFAICGVLASIVMYDAAGVRRETGTQATVINQILRDVLINGKQISDDELKELVGHTPLEVLCGAILGVLVACVYLLLWVR